MYSESTCKGLGTIGTLTPIRSLQHLILSYQVNSIYRRLLFCFRTSNVFLSFLWLDDIKWCCPKVFFGLFFFFFFFSKNKCKPVGKTQNDVFWRSRGRWPLAKMHSRYLYCFGMISELNNREIGNQHILFRFKGHMRLWGPRDFVLLWRRISTQPRSQGPLSTSRKYPGYGWSRVC